MTCPKPTTEFVRTYCRLRPPVERAGECVDSPSEQQIVSDLCSEVREQCRHEIFVDLNEGDARSILRLYQPELLPTSPRLSSMESSSNFAFDHVFGVEASQTDIFEQVLGPLIVSFLNGINGCVFCYGQTGSGKTWTMSGADNYQSRGLVQRAIEALFSGGSASNFSITYMEIYNEQAFDLLGGNNTATLPKVTLREDDKGVLNLTNLSVHSVKTAEEGLELFLQGNLNRVVSATPMNKVSSRSHCVFTVENRGAKLHLVDLAGSERVAKSGVKGQITLRESGNINKSLHYLEHVIDCLAGAVGGRVTHVPFRNSVLTHFLRDSISGIFSCKTVMIANISLNVENYKETVFTCRFAQRCGRVKNAVQVHQLVKVGALDAGTQTDTSDPCDTTVCGPCVPTVRDEPLNGGDVCVSSHTFPQISVYSLMDRCGTNLAKFPASVRSKMLHQLSDEGMDYCVSSVADLCLIVQLLLSVIPREEERRQVKQIGELDSAEYTVHVAQNEQPVEMGNARGQPDQNITPMHATPASQPVEVILTEIRTHEWRREIPLDRVEDLTDSL